ncbi:MAG: PhoH family protein [Deltaproteobacteria bacterium]|nr:PhoH family protein [Deltaproteobacteria bacterium]
MKKTFVLDTNVLLYDAQAILRFKEHDVIICFSVLEEIDAFKRDMTETGRNARQFSRYLDEFRKKGNLAKGVKIGKEGGKLLIDLSESERKLFSSPAHKSALKNDNIILAAALRLTKKLKHQVIFLTKDTNLRIRADVLGVFSQDYDPQPVDIDHLYTGMTQAIVPTAAIDQFYTERLMKPPSEMKLYPNQCVLLKDETNENHTAAARYDGKKEMLVPLRKRQEGIWGIFPKNLEQSFALDLLLNDHIRLVSLVGKAGTGKTLLALAAGLLKTLDEGEYKKLLVSRPIYPMGKDLGYLPGDIEEKLNPWMQPIFDNLEFLLGNTGYSSKEQGRSRKHGYMELMSQGMLNIEPLTYIRGRSIPQQYMIVDEAQNLTPHEIKTIITRVGENTKIILTGDCYQIDNPYVDASSNGLTYVVERFRNEAIAGHVTLTKGERSELAELAANLL